MKLEDSRTLDADVNTVWAALLDREVLEQSVPGCKELTGSPEEGFEATVVQKVGPVKATFKGAVELSDLVEPESLTITGEGKGGAAGFAKGDAHVRLEAQGAQTILHYAVNARVGGKLAQLGSRIVDSFAKKMADEFFDNFQQAVAPPEPEAEDAGDGEDVAAKKGWFRRRSG